MLFLPYFRYILSQFNSYCCFYGGQMFIFDKAGEGQVSTHQFEITGSTYAPEGEV